MILEILIIRMKSLQFQISWECTKQFGHKTISLFILFFLEHSKSTYSSLITSSKEALEEKNPTLTMTPLCQEAPPPDFLALPMPAWPRLDSDVANANVA
jgi:hypothetical protein